MAQAQDITNVSAHPAVVAAEQALAPLRARRAALEQERTLAWRRGGSGNTFTDQPIEHASEEEIGLARIRLPEIDIELRRLRAEEAPAERALRAATLQARTDLLAAVDVERRKVVARLDRKLREAEAVNAELIVLDEQATLVGGNFTALAAWPELMAERPTHQSRCSCWRTLMRAAGLMD